MRKFLLSATIVLALAGVPAAAFATSGEHHGPTTTSSTFGDSGTTSTTVAGSENHKSTSKGTEGSRHQPVVMYVIHGTVTAYTAATTTASGSITITAKGSNFESSTLNGLTLTFVTSAHTKVELFKDAPVAIGDTVLVKVKGAKSLTATVLQTETPFQIVDQGTGTGSESSTSSTETSTTETSSTEHSTTSTVAGSENHKPTSKGTEGSRHQPVVMYVIHGTVTAYTAATTTASGSITITAKGSNFESSTLRGLTLTFVTSAHTKVELFKDAPVAIGDTVLVKVQGAKSLTATVLQTETPFQIVDQGTSTNS